MRCALALPLLVLTFSTPAFSRPAPAPLAEVQTYDDLLRAIRQVQTASQKRIDQAINQEKVRAAWETGKLIDEHVLQHKERADYGEQVIIKLARDLGSSDTELKYMLQFARAYPIRPTSDELTWSHYRELLALNDPQERSRVEERAKKEKWSVKKVRQEVARINGARRRASSLETAQALAATPGKPGTYRVVVAVDGPYKKQLALDLGFSSFFRPEKFGKFKPGDIVKNRDSDHLFSRNGKWSLSLFKNATSKDLFTYPAYVRHVIDGDTFYAMIDLGFGFTTIQKLRLRGLDAPEIESSEGQEAKEFLASLLARSSLRVLGTGGAGDEDKAIPTAVLIHTEKSDKYDRYLADVWVGDTYVNQELLSHGLALRVSE